MRLLRSGPVRNPSRQMWSDSDIAGIQTERRAERGRRTMFLSFIGAS